MTYSCIKRQSMKIYKAAYSRCIIEKDVKVNIMRFRTLRSIHRRTGRGGGGGGSPPSFFGQSGNIRSTVGQFWFEIKKNGTNSVNFG